MNVTALITGIISILLLGIPVTNAAITAANLTGVAATIVNTLPLVLVAILILFVFRKGLGNSSK